MRRTVATLSLFLSFTSIHAFTNPVSFLTETSSFGQNYDNTNKKAQYATNDDHPLRLRVHLSARKQSSSQTTSLTDISDRREWLQSASLFGCGLASTSLYPVSSLAEELVTSIALCDPSVSTWKNVAKNRVVHILGTAHISSSSADLAGQLVRETHPDAVFVELDAKRVKRALPSKEPKNDDNNDSNFNNSDNNDPSPTSDKNSMSQTSSTTLSNNASEVEQKPLTKTNPFDLREKAMRYSSQALGSAIKGLYKKLESEGFNAGAEFQVAVAEGLKQNSKIILGDQDVEVTLRHLAEAVSKTDMKRLLSADSDLEKSMTQLMPGGNVVQSSLEKGEMNKEQLTEFVEVVKAKENVRLIMSNLKQVAPEIYGAMVAERDTFMANGLNGLNQFPKTVAVMGIAHVDGVENNLRNMGWVPVAAGCPLVKT